MSFSALRMLARIIQAAVILLAVLGFIIVIWSIGEGRTATIVLMLGCGGTALTVLLGLALAELLLFFARSGDMLTRIESRLGQLAEIIGETRRAEVVEHRASPVQPAPLPVDPGEGLRRRRRAEGKCILCGVALNYARISIEKKAICPSCEAQSTEAVPDAPEG